MKKRWIILIIILGAIIFFLEFKFISFSETIGIVTDMNGNPIKEANVTITYSCSRVCWVCMEGGGIGEGFGERITTTDNSGGFRFNSLFRIGINHLFPLYNCHKSVRAHRDYGLRNLYRNRYEGCYKLEKVQYTTSISSNEKEVSIKLSPDPKCKDVSINNSCSYYIPTCEGNPIFNDIIKNKEINRCDESCLIQREGYGPTERYDCNFMIKQDMCYTEIAILEKDPSICNKITYTSEIDEVMKGVNPKYSSNPEYQTNYSRRMCFKILARELKDPSLCDKEVFDEYTERIHKGKSYCKKDAIIATGDISKCSDIFNQQLKKECKYEIAINSGDIKQCSEISDLKLTSLCRTYFT